MLNTVECSISIVDKILILGDLNTWVGSDLNYGPALGKFGKGSSNANGELFCSQQQLSITNTYFYQPDNHYYTWKHPRSKHYHLFNCILKWQNGMKDLLNTRAMNAFQTISL